LWQKSYFLFLFRLGKEFPHRFQKTWKSKPHREQAVPQHSILNAASLWTELASGQKQQLQKLLFPSGVTFVDGIYKTTETCLIFKLLNESAAIKTNLANLPGIESCFAIFDNHSESLRKPYE